MTDIASSSSSVFAWKLDQLLANIRVAELPESCQRAVSAIKLVLDGYYLHVIGSCAIHAADATDTSRNVDIALEMPEAMFADNPKCHLNFQYLNIKTEFLGSHASALAEKLNCSVQLSYFRGCPYSPILLIKSPAFCGYSIRIFPAAPLSAVNQSRVAPRKNSIRPHAVKGVVQTITDPDSLPSTSRYNNAILRDQALIRNTNYVSQYCQPTAVDAVLLLKLWARQRSLSGLSGFVLSMIVAWFVSSKRVSVQFTPLEIFLTALRWFVATDLVHEPVFLTENGESAVSGFSRNDFNDSFEVCLICPTGKVNLLSGCSEGYFRHLQDEAKSTLAMLQDSVSDNFEAIFINKASIYFDNSMLISVPVSASCCGLLGALRCFAASAPPNKGVAPCDLLNCGSLQTALALAIENTLKNALGVRVRYVYVTPLDAESGTFSASSFNVMRVGNFSLLLPIDLDNDKTCSRVRFRIGLCLDPRYCNRAVDYGPAAENQAAAQAFRKMWGDKAELRKFPDGTILEVVVWNTAGEDGFDVRSGFTEIASRFILARHFAVQECQYIGNQIFNYIRAPSTPKTMETTFFGVGNALDEFCRQLQTLELPLHVVDIRPSHPALRYSSLLIPQPVRPARFLKGSCPNYHEPMDVVIQLESSNRWPLDLAALRLTKASYYCALSGAIQADLPGFVPSVFAELSENLMVAAGVDVITPNGYTFRCRISVPHELQLIENKLHNPSITKAAKASLKRAVFIYQKHSVYGPAYTSKIRSLVQKFPALSPTIRSVKRWVACHLMLTALDGYHFSDEFIEMICTCVFNHEVNPPATAHLGFVRVMQMLARWNYKEEPIVVSFNEERPDENFFSESKAIFIKSKKDDPTMAKDAIFVIPHGLDVDISTEDIARMSCGRITYPLLIKLTTLATAASKALTYETCSETIFGRIFTASTKQFDAIIQLDEGLCARLWESRKATNVRQPEIYQNSHGNVAIGFDPVKCYMEDLQNFSDIALFFHDRFGGTFIGVVFKPSASFSPRPMKKLVKYPLVELTNGAFRIDIKMVLAQMIKNGRGIVKSLNISRDLEQKLK